MRLTAVALVTILAATALFSGTLSAQTFTYVPTPADCWDLDHSHYYTWGIDVSELQGWTITEAELVIENITNWDNLTNVLYIHLLNDAALGLASFNDDENAFGDPFAAADGLIDAFTDNNGAGTTEDLHYLFSDLGLIPLMNGYAADGVIGLGLDPDCHYYNDGITLIITGECPSSGTENKSWSQVKYEFSRR